MTTEAQTLPYPITAELGTSGLAQPGLRGTHPTCEAPAALSTVKLATGARKQGRTSGHLLVWGQGPRTAATSQGCDVPPAVSHTGLIPGGWRSCSRTGKAKPSGCPILSAGSPVSMGTAGGLTAPTARQGAAANMGPSPGALLLQQYLSGAWCGTKGAGGGWKAGGELGAVLCSTLARCVARSTGLTSACLPPQLNQR